MIVKDRAIWQMSESPCPALIGFCMDISEFIEAWHRIDLQTASSLKRHLARSCLLLDGGASL